MLINVKKKRNGYNLPNIFQGFTLVSLNRLVSFSFLALFLYQGKLMARWGGFEPPTP
jgi:hypothetical protein